MMVFVWGSPGRRPAPGAVDPDRGRIDRQVGTGLPFPGRSGGEHSSGVAIGIVATTASVAGSMRESVPSISLYTQIEPCPAAMARGLVPTGTVVLIWPATGKSAAGVPITIGVGTTSVAVGLGCGTPSVWGAASRRDWLLAPSARWLPSRLAGSRLSIGGGAGRGCIAFPASRRQRYHRNRRAT